MIKVFNCNDNIESYISNYTAESFYYRYLNEFLRDADFDNFRKLSSHISKFIYHLYDYRKNIKNCISKNRVLYRVLYLDKSEIKKYQRAINRVICFPSFTSTSIVDGGFTPHKYNPNDILFKLIIKQNNSKSVIPISEFSQYKNEQEYLFLPFSFFKVINVIEKKNQCTIFLLALDSEKPIEEMFLDFIQNETDNLDPEELDMLLLTNNYETIIFNPIYYTSKTKIKENRWSSCPKYQYNNYNYMNYK